VGLVIRRGWVVRAGSVGVAPCIRQPPPHPARLPARAPPDCNAIATSCVLKLCRPPWRGNRRGRSSRLARPSHRSVMGGGLPDRNGRWQVCPARMGLYRLAGLAVTNSSRSPVKPGMSVRLHGVPPVVRLPVAERSVWTTWPACSAAAAVDRPSTSVYGGGCSYQGLGLLNAVVRSASPSWGGDDHRRCHLARRYRSTASCGSRIPPSLPPRVHDRSSLTSPGLPNQRAADGP
jgi:hypothetical protein